MNQESFGRRQDKDIAWRQIFYSRRKLFGLGFVVLAVLGVYFVSFLNQAAPGWFAEIKQTISSLVSVSRLLGRKSALGPGELSEFGNQASPLPIPQEAASYEEQIIRVAEYADNSVVSIIVSKDLPVLEQYFINPFEGWGFEVPDFNIPQYRQKGTEKKEIGGGTGFVVSAGGLLVTNKHVVADSEAEYTVLFNDGSKLSAQVIGRDPVFDLALLRVNRGGLPPLALGDSSALKLGQTVIAIGNSLGEFRNTVSVGVVSGIGRSLQVEGETLTDLIQTDAAINRGNSGGPLLNLKGQVIGINTAVALGAENIGFTIPINQVKKTIEQVQTIGSIKTAYLGIYYVLVNDKIQAERKLPVAYGALLVASDSVPAVVPDSPAQRAGLQEGDIILAIGNQKITAQTPLDVLLKSYNPGETITLKILRAGKEMEIKITLGER
jgi:serine protease Do